jgi:hypothetical protein
LCLIPQQLALVAVHCDYEKSASHRGDLCNINSKVRVLVRVEMQSTSQCKPGNSTHILHHIA